jgi:hypothetical protein
MASHLVVLIRHQWCASCWSLYPSIHCFFALLPLLLLLLLLLPQLLLLLLLCLLLQCTDQL